MPIHVKDKGKWFLVDEYTEPTLYQGVDLTIKFADEIANFSNEWAWMKNRIQNANFKGLHIGDYIPFTMTQTDGTFSCTLDAQIAGIDTYYENNTTSCPHHIDFISRECYPLRTWNDGGITYTTIWNETENNNGTANEPSPWKASYLYNLLNNVMFNYLPNNLRLQIINKDWLVEYRYSASGILTDSNGYDWGTLGKLWLPTETEVCGACVWGTKGYSVGTSIQYPIFANKNKKKHAGKNGSRCSWWLLTICGNSSTDALYIGSYGTVSSMVNINGGSINNTIPICFRIG